MRTKKIPKAQMLSDIKFRNASAKGCSVKTNLVGAIKKSLLMPMSKAGKKCKITVIPKAVIINQKQKRIR